MSASAHSEVVKAARAKGYEMHPQIYGARPDSISVMPVKKTDRE